MILRWKEEVFTLINILGHSCFFITNLVSKKKGLNLKLKIVLRMSILKVRIWQIYVWILEMFMCLAKRPAMRYKIIIRQVGINAITSVSAWVLYSRDADSGLNWFCALQRFLQELRDRFKRRFIQKRRGRKVLVKCKLGWFLLATISQYSQQVHFLEETVKILGSNEWYTLAS